MDHYQRAVTFFIMVICYCLSRYLHENLKTQKSTMVETGCILRLILGTVMIVSLIDLMAHIPLQAS